MRRKCKINAIKTLTDTVRGFVVTRFFTERFGNVKQYSPAGVDSAPPTGARALVEDIGGDPSQKAITSFIDEVAKVAGEGEIRIYSTSDGTSVAAYVFAKASGVVQLNGSEFGGLIKIEELTLKLNELVAQYNAHLGSTLNSESFIAEDFVKSDYENTKVVH